MKDRPPITGVDLSYQALVTAAVLRHVERRATWMIRHEHAANAAHRAWNDWWKERSDLLVRMRRANNLEEFYRREKERA
jgi:hypothetical protein